MELRTCVEAKEQHTASKGRQARRKPKTSNYPTFWRNKTCQILTWCLYLAHARRENGKVRKPQTCSQPEQEMKEIGSHRKYAADGRRNAPLLRAADEPGREIQWEREISPPFARWNISTELIKKCVLSASRKKMYWWLRKNKQAVQECFRGQPTQSFSVKERW